MGIEIKGALPATDMDSLEPGDLFVAYTGNGDGYLLCMRASHAELDPVAILGSEGTMFDRQGAGWLHAQAVVNMRLHRIPDAHIEILREANGLPAPAEYSGNGSIIIGQSGGAWLHTQIGFVNQATFSLQDGSWSAPTPGVQTRYDRWRLVRQIDGLEEPVEIYRHDPAAKTAARAAANG